MLTHRQPRRVHSLRFVPGPAMLFGLAAFLLTLGGCKSHAHIHFDLGSCRRAAVTVEGSNPMVYVKNAGPGKVQVQYAPNGDLAPAREPLILGTAGRNLRDGGIVEITNESDEHAMVSVREDQAEGVVVREIEAAS